MRIIPLLVVALSITGCGASPCGIAEQAVANYNNKRGMCQIAAVTLNAPACRERERSCTPSDIEKLRSFSNCTGALPECNSSNSTAFGVSALACLSNYDGMSTACRDATAIRF